MVFDGHCLLDWSLDPLPLSFRTKFDQMNLNPISDITILVNFSKIFILSL